MKRRAIFTKSKKTPIKEKCLYDIKRKSANPEKNSPAGTPNE